MEKDYKAFSVEEWKKGGKQVVTDSGRRVDILAIDEGLIAPIVGIVRSNGDFDEMEHDTLNQWWLDGTDEEGYRPNDLFLVDINEK